MKNHDLFVCGEYFYDVLIRNITKLEQANPPLFNKKGFYNKQLASFKHLLDISSEASENLLETNYESTAKADALYEKLKRGFELYLDITEHQIKIFEKFAAGAESEVRALFPAYGIKHKAMEQHLNEMLPVWQAFCIEE